VAPEAADPSPASAMAMPNKMLRFSDVSAKTEEGEAADEVMEAAPPVAASASAAALPLPAAATAASAAPAAAPEGEGIQVYLRIRPLNEREREANAEPTSKALNDTSVEMRAPEVRGWGWGGGVGWGGRVSTRAHLLTLPAHSPFAPPADLPRVPRRRARRRVHLLPRV
jgi:hypothetical protein